MNFVNVEGCKNWKFSSLVGMKKIRKNEKVFKFCDFSVLSMLKICH